MEITDLLKRVDLVALASQFTTLERRGSEYWGISPLTFPPENTPSFSVRQNDGEPGKFFDFSSGAGGSAITLLKMCKNITSYEAIKELEKYVGVSEGDVVISDKCKLSATQTCCRYRKPTVTAKESKGTILPDDCMEKYERSIEKLKPWTDEGISAESLEQFQVRYDSFTNQIVYPIRNYEGKICNIGCRTLDPRWKEKGLRKYSYRYQWGKMQVIYGLAENLESIREKHEIIVFEGCKSVLKAASWGITNCGALLTSHLSQEQLKILARLGCDVIFMLDREVNIRQDHNINKLKRYVNVFYYIDYDNLLGEKDSPVDKGKRTFDKLLSQRAKFK